MALTALVEGVIQEPTPLKAGMVHDPGNDDVLLTCYILLFPLSSSSPVPWPQPFQGIAQTDATGRTWDCPYERKCHWKQLNGKFTATSDGSIVCQFEPTDSNRGMCFRCAVDGRETAPPAG